MLGAGGAPGGRNGTKDNKKTPLPSDTCPKWDGMGSQKVTPELSQEVNPSDTCPEREEFPSRVFGKVKTDRYNAFDIDFRKSGRCPFLTWNGQERSVWISEKSTFKEFPTNPKIAECSLRPFPSRSVKIPIPGPKSGIFTDLRRFGRKLHSAVIGIFENSSRSVKMLPPKIHLGGLFVVQIGFLEILVPPVEIQKS